MCSECDWPLERTREGTLKVLRRENYTIIFEYRDGKWRFKAVDGYVDREFIKDERVAEWEKI